MPVLYRLFSSFRKIIKKALVFFLFPGLFYGIEGNLKAEPSEEKLKVLYNSLEPTALFKQIAFYQLYGHLPIGKKALEDIQKVLFSRPAVASSSSIELEFTPSILYAITSLVQTTSCDPITLIKEKERPFFLEIAKRLPHYILKGHLVWSEDELLTLTAEEIDLGRGLFITLFGADRDKIESYEAALDLLAIQVLARLPKNPKAEDKIQAINQLLFEELGFRFPPHSLSTKHIDLYSFLPSVLDSKKGVCLGVSILYICLAQRVDLALEIVTPPGHIFVRARTDRGVINIETTARGVHIDSEEYLTLNIKSLQERTIKETIGLAHFNQASVFWQTCDFAKALASYEKAERYLEGDILLKEMKGYALILNGREKEGRALLWEVKDQVPPYALSRNSLAEEYLEGKVDREGLELLFTKEELEHAALIEKKKAFEVYLQKKPQFRSGVLTLATLWLKLHRYREALETLLNFLKLDENEPQVHYYLSILYAQRRDFNNAWYHAKRAEELILPSGYNPKELKDLRRELVALCPEPAH